MEQPDEYHFQVSQRDAWETRYRLKGRQWGNAPSDFTGIIPTGTVLELGIGDGKNLRTRNTEGIFPIGLDFSPTALRLCRSDPSLCSISLLLGDMCFLPLRSETIDHIFAHHILGHIPIRLSRTLIDEMYRILRPEGRAIVTVFARGDMREGTGKEVEPGTFLRGDGIITRYFTPDDIILLAGKFKVMEVRREEWPLRLRGKKKIRVIFVALLQKNVQ
jgi:SAM-dependent methyltransferase